VSDAKQVTEQADMAVADEDRAWLDEQLRDYAELLAYLREH
jgi:hypothetical protein